MGKRLIAFKHVLLFELNKKRYKLAPTNNPYKPKFIGRLRWYLPVADEHFGMTDNEFIALVPEICDRIGIFLLQNEMRLEQLNSIKGQKFTVRQHLLHLPDGLELPLGYVVPCEVEQAIKNNRSQEAA
jgi:hypothetical protein